MPPSELTANLAIMFADISGSTAMYETLGDTLARQRISESMETMGKVVAQNAGRVVKTNGDDMLCVFEVVENAALAACGMQEALAESADNNPSNENALSVRIGIHAGPAILENGDVFGDAVNVAARMVQQAKMGQIITTRHLIEQLSSMLQGSSRLIDHTEVKGKKESVDLYEIMWQQAESTLMSADIVVRPAAGNQLVVTFGDRSITLSQSIRTLVIGRSQQADLHVDEAMASRLHARIEYRRGKYFLVDQSTNGTYVRQHDVESYVRREEVPLGGSGTISLGRPVADDSPTLVHFEAKEQPAE